MGHLVYGHGVQPDPPGSRERAEEDTLAAEEHVRDALDPGDAELHGRLEHRHVPRLDAHRLAWFQTVLDGVAIELGEDHARTGHLLKDEALAAHEAGAELLGEGDVEL